MSDETTNPTRYDWPFFWQVALKHRKVLMLANVVALGAALVSVPIPLLMPLLVDEVLLDKPGKIVEFLETVLPEAWQGPVAFIVTVMVVTMALRLASLMLAVLQRPAASCAPVRNWQPKLPTR